MSDAAHWAWAFKEAHGRLRTLVEGMDPAKLNAALGPETNSIAVLVTHALGSERQVLTMVADRSEPRDRDAEFRALADGPAGLLRALDAADRLVDEIVPRLTDQQRARDFSRNEVTQSGERWLLRSFGHLREHAAHAEITRQLLESKP